ncbi:hypothetical protein [Chitinophaga rhizophila]|uniref:MerC mercury resistance protein n=1 Tax=Chitinophaga rhizophila TaxID=2866212 RepID=A0ABS7GN20_9BACT|nr:hypothetical protein [Chitinophaga rhizophila]MBW8688352.1 hypothetical protein [Chitinophaga rhizophila]
MKRLAFIASYILFVCIWCILYYQFIAPVKGTQLVLVLLMASLFYSLIWGLFVSLLQRVIGWKGYGMLLIPLLIIIVFFVGMDRSNFLFICGLIAISELVSFAKIVAHKRKSAS